METEGRAAPRVTNERLQRLISYERFEDRATGRKKQEEHDVLLDLQDARATIERYENAGDEEFERQLTYLEHNSYSIGRMAKTKTPIETKDSIEDPKQKLRTMFAARGQKIERLEGWILNQSRKANRGFYVNHEPEWKAEADRIREERKRG